MQAYPPVLIFYGHLHYNREQQWGDARIYCTAAASSVSDASYRVIDIDDKGDELAFRMRLEIVLPSMPAEKLAFVTIDEQSWRLAK